MKKNQIILSIFLLLIAFLAIGCSTDVDSDIDGIGDTGLDDAEIDTGTSDITDGLSDDLSVESDCDALLGMEKAECYINIGKASRDYTVCEGLSPDLAYWCYYEMAVELNDQEICTYASDDQVVVDTCKGNVRMMGRDEAYADVEDGSFEDCQNYAQQESAAAVICYMTLAQQESNYEYCEYIVGASNGGFRSQCFANVAIDLDDVSICDHATLAPEAVYEVDPVEICVSAFERGPIE